jgi:hypothetical protein
MHDDNDWRINLKALAKQKLTLLVIKDGAELFRSSERSVTPLVDLLEANMDQLTGTTVVDRIVGVATAKLLLWQQVRRIDTEVASLQARELLRHSGVVLNYGKLVPRLVDQKSGQPDRYEVLSIRHDHPELFYRALREELLIFKTR